MQLAALVAYNQCYSHIQLLNLVRRHAQDNATYQADQFSLAIESCHVCVDVIYSYFYLYLPCYTPVPRLSAQVHVLSGQGSRCDTTILQK